MVAARRARAFLEVSRVGSVRVPICSAGELAIAGGLAAAEQHVICTVEYSGKLYCPPTQPVWDVMRSLGAQLFVNERVRRCTELAVFTALAKEAASSCSATRIGEQHSIQVRASVLDMQPFAEKHAGEWQREKYCVALTSHAEIPLAAG